jgi:hypothetical protein
VTGELALVREAGARGDLRQGQVGPCLQDLLGSFDAAGDGVWDLLAARRARALGVGLLSGGHGQDELERAGAHRVHQDPADLLQHLDDVGARAAE